MKDDEYPKIMNTAQAAKYVGVCEVTLRQLVLDGKVRAVKIAKGWRYTKADLVDAFTAKRSEDA